MHVLLRHVHKATRHLVEHIVVTNHLAATVIDRDNKVLALPIKKLAETDADNA